MSDETREADKLEAWLGPAEAYKGFLVDYLPEDVEFDYSLESLEGIQAYLVDEFDDGGEGSETLRDGIAAYFGTMLLDVEDSRAEWGWDGGTDRPVVRGRDGVMVSPIEVIDKVFGSEPNALVDQYREWVARYQ
jgi:hypothetical protein